MAGPWRARRAASLLIALALAVSVSGCSSNPAATGSPAATTAGSPPASLLPGSSLDARVAGWRSDLEVLIPQMDLRHPNLTHGTSIEALEAAVEDLTGAILTATDDELLVGVLRIVAMVSAAGCDGHTGAFVWGTGSYPVHSLPLRLWWFDDGVYVIDALDPYRDLIGARIDTIAGRETSEVIAAIEPLVPRDNDSTVRLLMPRFLLMPEVLRGLGLAAPATGTITLGLTPHVGDVSGADGDVAVEPIAMADYNAWAGAYGLHLPADPRVPYLSRIGDALWWEPLPGEPSTLFVQQNRVERPTAPPLAELRTALAGPGVRTIVLDLRHNFGGEVSAVDPFVDLFEDPAVDVPGRLFVITGRNTFSAAGLMVARLTGSTQAELVGEPMGGCPTAYGDAEEFELPHSHIVIDVPTVLEVGVSADDTRLTVEPDLSAPLSFDDWRTGVDPALQAVAAATGAGP